MSRRAGILASLFAAAALAGCAQKPAPAEAVAGYVGQAPHGGTIVALGDGDYHVELVLEPGSGTLSGYLLDDDLEKFVRSSSPAFTLETAAGGAARTLVLSAVANPATGETVGDSSQFSARADWLRTAREFDGTLQGLVIGGATYPPAKFKFPGNQAPTQPLP